VVIEFNRSRDRSWDKRRYGIGLGSVRGLIPRVPLGSVGIGWDRAGILVGLRSDAEE
jgi:hypothetical protein